MAEVETITFDASVSKLYTLVDGGLRVTLDLPETAIMQAAQLLECKRAGVALKVTCEAVDCKAVGNNAIQEGTKRKSEWAPAER